ncbi:hypothetical protein GGD81_002200 [Rhodobium orientis]|nr:hypothetical protein [Rhodobium orientis]
MSRADQASKGGIVVLPKPDRIERKDVALACQRSQDDLWKIDVRPCSCRQRQALTETNEVHQGLKTNATSLNVDMNGKTRKTPHQAIMKFWTGRLPAGYELFTADV